MGWSRIVDLSVVLRIGFARRVDFAYSVVEREFVGRGW